MNLIFIQWGLPKKIKVDNGRPFGDPRRDGLPLLSMWLIGLGVEVIWNRPRTPQDNAKVERCQGTLGNWTEYEKTTSTQELQQILKRECDFYNYTFRDRRKNNTTRLERHPSLSHSGRPYIQDKIDEEKIATFVSDGMWQRIVSTMGQVSIVGQRFSVGCQYRHQQVAVQLDPLEKTWVVSDAAGNEIARSPATIWNRWIKKVRGVT